MTKFKSFSLVLLAATLPFSNLLAEEKPAFSGFLGNYSDFTESKRVKGAWIYSKQEFTVDDLKNYDKLVIDPVQMMPHEEAEIQTITVTTPPRL